MSEWHPIETAPKDGQHLLLYAPEIQFVGFYANDTAKWCYVAPRMPTAPTQPTFWRELEEPPKEQTKAIEMLLELRRASFSIFDHPQFNPFYIDEILKKVRLMASELDSLKGN